MKNTNKNGALRSVACAPETWIYGLVDPRNRRTMYVGRTKNMKSRLSLHMSAGSRRVGSWVAELVAAGLRPEMVVVEHCPPGADATTAERTAIRDAEAAATAGGYQLLNSEAWFVAHDNITHRGDGSPDKPPSNKRFRNESRHRPSIKLTLPRELLAALATVVGDGSRSAFIELELRRALGLETMP